MKNFLKAASSVIAMAILFIMLINGTFKFLEESDPDINWD